MMFACCRVELELNQQTDHEEELSEQGSGAHPGLLEIKLEIVQLAAVMLQNVRQGHARIASGHLVIDFGQLCA